MKYSIRQAGQFIAAVGCNSAIQRLADIYSCRIEKLVRAGDHREGIGETFNDTNQNVSACHHPSVRRADELFVTVRVAVIKGHYICRANLCWTAAKPLRVVGYGAGHVAGEGEHGSRLSLDPEGRRQKQHGDGQDGFGFHSH